MKRSRWQVGYGIALALLLIVWLFTRRAAILAGAPSTVDVLVALLLTCLILTPLFSQVTIGGITLKNELAKTEQRLARDITDLRAAVLTNVSVAPIFNVQQLVQREVSRAQEEALHILRDLDLALIPLWDRKRSSVPDPDPEARLRLIENQIEELKTRASKSTPDERVHFDLVLRSLFWMRLEEARELYASSQRYQTVRAEVEAALKGLGQSGPGTV